MDPKDTELADLKAAVKAKEAEITTLKTKVSGFENDGVVKAKDAEIATLKQEKATLEGQIKAHRTEKAKATVQAAVQAGKLAPQATEVHAKWVQLIEADEANATLLDSMPVQASLGTVVPPGGSAVTHTTTQTGANGEHAFVVKAKALATERKIDFAQATQELCATNEGNLLYKAYCDSLQAK